MKVRKKTILEIGNSPLSQSVITKIVNAYLMAYGTDWTLVKAHQWEVHIDGEDYQDFSGVEEKIIAEVTRLSRLYWDLYMLGFAE